jgi:hypothetical protein
MEGIEGIAGWIGGNAGAIKLAGAFGSTVAGSSCPKAFTLNAKFLP